MTTPFNKQYHSPEQLALLLQSRNLVIDNISFAAQKLRQISYYRFSAYLYPFLAHPKSAQIFKANSNFHTALSLYDFDQKLRILAFTEIAKIEVAIRSALANIASKETGNLFWMTDISMYANADRFRKTMNFIDKELNASKEDFIVHFKRKYSNPYPPAWILTEILPIGVLNHIYGNLANNALRKKIADEFSLKVPVFSSWFTIIALTRNACCHHARIWNKQNTILPTEPKKMLLPWINTPVPTNRIYYDLCILKYFVNIIDINNNMTHNLSSLLTDYPNVDILAMGFPANWKNEPLWKILQ